MVEIYDLSARYCEALDGDRPEDLAACFARDAIWESDVMGVRRGAAEIGSVVGELARLGDGRPFHQTTGIRVLEADRAAGQARSRARWLATYQRRNAVSFGIYSDEIERSDGGAWRFRSRELVRVSEPEVFRAAPDRLKQGGERYGRS